MIFQRFKNLFTRKKLVLYLTFIVVLCLLYQSDSLYSAFKKKVNTRVEKYTGVDLLGSVDRIAHTFDIVKYWKSWRNPIEEIDCVRLIIPEVSQKKLNEFLESNPVRKKWVAAKIELDGETFECKIKYHGTDDAHYINGKYSYSIKLKNITGYYNNAKRYKLIKGEEAEPTIFASNHLAKELGLIAPIGSMKMLKINDKEVGHYYFTEDVKKGFLEREFGITNYTVLANVSDWSRKERATLRTPHISDLDLYMEHLEDDDGLLHSKGVAIYGNICDLIEDNNVEELVKYFDPEYIGKFMALASVFNDVHFLTGDNLKLIYDFSKGKFYPLYRAEHAWQGLNNEVVQSEGRTINSYPDYNKLLFESFPLYRTSINTRLFKLLLSHQKVREARDKALFELTSKKQKFIKDVLNIHSENNHVQLNSNIHRKSYRIKRNEQIEFVSSMFPIAARYLSYNHIYGSYDSLSNQLSVINDGFCELKMIRMSDSVTVGVIPGINMDSNLDLKYDKNLLTISDTSFNVKNYHFVNTITTDTVSKKHIHFNFVDTSNELETKSTIEMLKDNSINFTLDSNHIKIKKGNYVIQSNIVVADSFKVTINKGVKFTIDSSKNILFYSDLEINGTADLPVVLNKNKNGSPFGTFAVVGRGYIPEVKIDFLNVSGGSETYFNGHLFTGQLAIYNAKVSVSNSTFMHSSGDDGLNIKYCKVQLDNCRFEQNKADQVDLDFCWAIASNCSFKPSQIDMNGDGLDVSGSNVGVHKCTFSGFVDKGISVGENSKIYINANRFHNNNSGITIKDQSQTYAWENEFLNNELDYSMYIKKSIFDKPSLYKDRSQESYKINIVEGDVVELNKSDLHNANKEFLNKFGNFYLF